MAKRKVKQVDFSKEGSHISLVSLPANGQGSVTILKSKNVDLEKAEEVKITTSMSTFLTMFFYMWREDANELAEILGYEPQEWSYELIGDDTKVELLKSLDENSTVSKELYENIEKMSSEFNKLIKDKTKKEEIMAKEKEKKTEDLEKEKTDDLAVELEKQKTEMAELKKALDLEKTKREELEKAAEKKEKDSMIELCKGYSFVDDAEKLADALFKCRMIEEFGVITDTLEKARDVITEALGKEHGTDEERNLIKDKDDPQYYKGVTEILKKRYTKKENK